MQQQVLKRNMSSELGWVSEGGGGGGWGQQTSALGSGSWTSTANQDGAASASTWQSLGKSDSASDGGDDSSSVKSGSAISNMSNITSQSQENTSINNSNALQSNSSGPWNSSNPSLSGMDASPWGNSGSPAPSSINSMGWSIPSSLSISNNPGHNSMQGSSMLNNSSAFNLSSASGWPNNTLASTTSLPSNLGVGGNGSGITSNWQGSTMLGNIGDFKSDWNSPTTPIDAIGKEIGNSTSDPRMWGLGPDKSGDGQWDLKSQWGNPSPGDQSASSSELSFAQATLKGLKAQPTTSASQTAISLRQEEILRNIENHEGWGSRPIRQDTSWDVESSPKSHRKFSADSSAGATNAAASNVWNNGDGTAIWEAVRDQSGNRAGGNPGNNSTWNAEKDQPMWTGPTKQMHEPSWNVGNGNDPKAFGTWGAVGGAGDASSKMWGQKTEVGSWGENPSTQRNSSWGDDAEPGGWEDQNRRVMNNMQGMVPPSPSLSGPPTNMTNMMPTNMSGMSNADVTPWNESQKPGWNPPNVGMNHGKIDEPWNKPPPNRSGWGDPAQEGVKVDDGTSIWQASAPKQLPPQPKPTSWEGSQGQWNAPVGTKPKAPVGWDEASWAMAQRAKSGRIPEDVSANSVEVGYWNGLPQDNSTWNDPAALRGVRKITGQQMPSKYIGSGNNPPNQMRAKLLQELMDMGYRKEEAQNALIMNNMNLKLALSYLKSANGGGMSRKDLDMDVFQTTNGSQSRLPYMQPSGMVSDDLADMRPDQVPPFSSMQNTQFPNSQVPNQPFLQTNLPSSSLSMNSTSINSSLQQKLAHKMQQAPPTPTLGQRGQIASIGSTTNQAPQQQQQILDQLRQAVSNGFISPQLLNYQLPHNILVLLQQLLQLQSALQTMVNKHQQMVQTARPVPGIQNNPQIDQMASVISTIRQQIVTLQKQLQQAQNNLFSSQKPPNMPPSNILAQPGQGQQSSHLNENIDSITSDIAGMALSQSKSRLASHWKHSDSGMEGNGGQSLGMSDDSENKIQGGAKGLLQSSSSPNLNLIPGGLGMTGDKTWSTNLTTNSSNWPITSSDSIGTSANSDQKMSSVLNSPAILQSSLNDVPIPEFVPGKPWQGLQKNVEDDPHVTPGSMQRFPSVNRVLDDSLNNLDGHKLNSTWGSGFKNDSLGLGQLGNRPPPIMAQNKSSGQQWQQGGIGRQPSWSQPSHSANSAFTKVGPSNWNDSRTGISSWIVLKNLSSSMDSSTVRTVCSQYGSLINFYHVAHAQLALLHYSSKDAAHNAQQRLNNFPLNNSVISAEFIAEAEAQRYMSQVPHSQPAVMPQWSQAPPSAPYQRGDPWGNAMPAGQPISKYSSGNLEPWNMWDISDHNSNPILNNILGSESM